MPSHRRGIKVLGTPLGTPISSKRFGIKVLETSDSSCRRHTIGMVAFGSLRGSQSQSHRKSGGTRVGRGVLSAEAARALTGVMGFDPPSWHAAALGAQHLAVIQRILSPEQCAKAGNTKPVEGSKSFTARGCSPCSQIRSKLWSDRKQGLKQVQP